MELDEEMRMLKMIVLKKAKWEHVHCELLAFTRSIASCLSADRGHFGCGELQPQNYCTCKIRIDTKMVYSLCMWLERNYYRSKKGINFIGQ